MAKGDICQAYGDLPAMALVAFISLSAVVGTMVIISSATVAYKKAIARNMAKHRNSVKRFICFLPTEIYHKKSCYFPLATHIIDQATDIAIIIEFYLIHKAEIDKNADCTGINGLSLFILSLIAFCFYRIISSIWVYTITHGNYKIKLFHVTLQMLDLKMYHALYINFVANKQKPNTIQKYLQLMEACLESFPQIIIQLFYFIKLNFTFSGNYLLLVSLIFSIYSVSTKITSEDQAYFVEKCKDSNFKCVWHKCKIRLNKYFVLRFIVRLMDVICRVTFLLSVWIYFGGIVAALYVGLQCILLAAGSIVMKKYVLYLLEFCTAR